MILLCCAFTVLGLDAGPGMHFPYTPVQAHGVSKPMKADAQAHLSCPYSSHQVIKTEWTSEIRHEVYEINTAKVTGKSAGVIPPLLFRVVVEGRGGRGKSQGKEVKQGHRCWLVKAIKGKINHSIRELGLRKLLKHY